MTRNGTVITYILTAQHAYVSEAEYTMVQHLAVCELEDSRIAGLLCAST